MGGPLTGQIVIAPLWPLPLLAAVAVAALLLLALTTFRRGRGVVWRILALLVLFAALLDPKLIEEERVARPDVALIVVDESPSQQQGDRQATTAAALDALTRSLAALDQVETRVVRVAPATDAAETRLFEATDRAMGDDVGGRLGAVFMITDGQVHDVPQTPPAWLQAPLHVLISGRRDDRDRRLTIEQVPAYGMVGETAAARFRVDELGAAEAGEGRAKPVAVRVSIDGNPAATLTVRPGVTETFAFPLAHAGPTVVEFAVDAAAGEISTVNNRAAAVVSGVRDRLKVLLVSGQPHSGERVWRNLLKSDPAVDLVHFTILRPPEKDDATPLRELSLIVFPVQELFETKLDDFDLIVFDRYALRGVLPLPYYGRIADYVRRGGALLLAVGPEFAGRQSLWHTPLGEVLPAEPTGRIIERGFQPGITDLGHRHPVTADLPGERAAGAGPVTTWGRWFRFVEATAGDNAATLLQTPDGRPLLVVERVGEGRVALLLSDQIWLWARGFEGGGPHGELLRRLGHWLMKEPELEEESLTATAANGRLVIIGRSLTEGGREVTVTAPSGREERVHLVAGSDGIARGDVPTPESGLWRVTDGTHTALAAAGRVNPREFADLRATDTLLSPLVRSTGGGLAWLTDNGTDLQMPDIRRVSAGAAASGDGWLGVKRNEAYTVTGVHQVSLLPGLAVLALAFALLAAAWWREGR
ncbi:MAG: hypothetical protein U1E42_02045 [Rhodospirillales bacterium]